MLVDVLLRFFRLHDVVKHPGVVAQAKREVRYVHPGAVYRHIVRMQHGNHAAPEHRVGFKIVGKAGHAASFATESENEAVRVRRQGDVIHYGKLVGYGAESALGG